MKQILLTALAAVAVLLSSCSKDDNDPNPTPDPTNPITGLEMPASSAQQPVITGATVSIKGSGFTASDEIWFSTTAKASGEVKAEGVVATATGLSFIAPTMDGETSVTLKQAGKSYPLGKMFFATKGENPLTEHVYVVKETDAGCEFLECDLDKGTFTSAFKVPVYTMGVVADNRSNIYYLAYDLEDNKKAPYVARYNLNENKEVRMSGDFEFDNTSIGMIDNQFHIMQYNQTKGFSLMSITDDGTETLVKAFGQLPDPKYRFFQDEDVRFVYDTTSKTIVFAGESEYNGGKDVASTILSFSLETGVITAKHKLESESGPISETSIWYNFAQTDTGVLLFTIQNTWSTTSEDADTEVGKTIIDYINPATLDKLSDVTTLDCEFESATYVAGKNTLLGIDFRKYEPSILLSYDLTAKILKQIDGSEDCEDVFTMFY